MPPKHNPKSTASVASLSHDERGRKNLPTAETENMLQAEEAAPVRVKHKHKNNPKKNPEMYSRDADLDPQLVWQGKDDEDTNGLSVNAYPIYVHEHIHPKVIIADLKRTMQNGRQNGKKGAASEGETPHLFEEWTGGLSDEDRLEFYAHQVPWKNRFILGDSLLVMQSLATKENMKGQVQCIYMDPPYGIKFASNWQPTTKSRVVKDKDITGEPEMIKAFRDTWKHGIHSYLSYLRDRLLVGREMLTDSGSFFMQIGEENVHLVRSLMDEVFGRENFISHITFRKKTPLGAKRVGSVCDYILWYAKNEEQVKYRPIYGDKQFGGEGAYTLLREDGGFVRRMTREEKQNPKLAEQNGKPMASDHLIAAGFAETSYYDFEYQGQVFKPSRMAWKTNREGMQRLIKADRLLATGKSIGYKRYFADFPVMAIDNVWMRTSGARDPIYVVQTNANIIARCILMATDPGDLVLDPTCGSGTTAYAAEKYGRRWITIDASRIAIAIARTRLMGGNFDWYLLQDSKEGADKESKLRGESSVTRRNAGGGGGRPFA